MLDTRQRVDLPGFPVQAFRDHLRPQAFYLIPERPELGRDEAGRPAAQLTVYGRTAKGRFDAHGGVVTLTTVLETSRPMERQARAMLARLLTGGTGDAAAIEILAVEWLGGTVTVRLNAEVALSGRPSLTAPNTCAFSERLGRETIVALSDAWRHGLPGGRIVYRLRARSAGAGAEGEALVFEGGFELDRDALGGTMATTNL